MRSAKPISNVQRMVYAFYYKTLRCCSFKLLHRALLECGIRDYTISDGKGGGTGITATGIKLLYGDGFYRQFVFIDSRKVALGGLRVINAWRRP